MPLLKWKKSKHFIESPITSRYFQQAFVFRAHRKMFTLTYPWGPLYMLMLWWKKMKRPTHKKINCLTDGLSPLSLNHRKYRNIKQCLYRLYKIARVFDHLDSFRKWFWANRKMSTFTYPWGPPYMLVLWWISFHVTWLGRPVVTDVPTVKTRRASKAFLKSCSTSLPSRLSGR